MADHLPDEILAEILTPLLRIPDNLFADTSRVSPFASYDRRSSSSYLCVSKRWLRICTPLLYHVVVLRSKPQADALAAVFKANGLLGGFVKKLRVEGGYGASMKKIVQATPHVTELFLTLKIYSNDSTVGLSPSLQLLPLRRIILCDHDRLENVHTKRLCESLCTFIKGADTLDEFCLSYGRTWMASTKDAYTIGIAESLRQAPHLRTVRMDALFDMEVSHLSIIVQNPAVEQVLIEPVTQSLNGTFGVCKYLESVRNARLKSILRVPELDQFNNQSKRHFVNPLSFAPEPVQNKIHSRIIQTFLEDISRKMWEMEDFDPLWYVHEDEILRQVSSSFERFTDEHWLRHAYCVGEPSWSTFRERISANPILGITVESLLVTATLLCITGGHLHPLLSRTPHLRRLSVYHGTKMSWDAFSSISALAGAKLEELAVRIEIFQAGVPNDPSIFETYGALQRLVWHSRAPFATGGIESDALPKLRELIVPQHDGSFLIYLSQIKLPLLRKLSVNYLSALQGFLEVHGGKLEEMQIKYAPDWPILDYCPNIKLLTWSIGVANPPFPTATNPHMCLRRIVLPHGRCLRPHPVHISKEKEATWRAFFSMFNDRTLFPVLQEIQVDGCTWPHDERGIAKDYWHQYAEDLAVNNISLVDTHGRGWKPRLRATKRTHH